MDRRERSDLLERLVAFRRLYRMRTDYDSKPILNVAAAVDYVERLMAATPIPPAGQAA